MIIDSFIFYNEFDMLELRFRELYDHVDWFILVEATRTFYGDEKPLYFAENKERYATYLPKVIHVVVSDMPMHTDAWGRERHQRNAIARGVSILNPPHNAVLLISDTDEIPDPKLLSTIPPDTIYGLLQDFYYYNYTWKNQKQWTAARACPVWEFYNYNGNADMIRNINIGHLRQINNAGWHFSYFGDADFIRKKIESFSHQELNLEKFKDSDHINSCIQTGNDLFLRESVGPHFTLKYIPMKFNPYLPKTVMSTIESNPSNIRLKYIESCRTSSDINEHLPTLARYASECSHVTECGVRNGVSSYAFAAALVGRPSTKLVQVDPTSYPNVVAFGGESAAEGLEVVFHNQNDLECPMEPTDLLFIDTWHVYGQLKRELARWHSVVAKYIILHDTTIDALKGETIRVGWNAEYQSRTTGIPVAEIRKGVWPAVEEFLAQHPEWTLRERYTNNNGLTVLQRNG